MSEQVLSESGVMDNPDNHPTATSKRYARELRAALIQEKKAIQERARALGMQIAAIEKEFNLDKNSDILA